MNWENCEKKLGVNFNNKSLLEQAFTHRSYLNENRNVKQEHNERLEFLGDAVLELIVTEYLYKTYPEKNEGDLTSYRSAVVNTQSLSSVASRYHFNDFLLLSKGESKDTGRARLYILANTFEAVIGAIFLDQGYENAQKFISDSLFESLRAIVEDGLWIDAKSRLQEVIQGQVSITPVYKTLNEEGPDHDKKFTVGVYVGEKEIGRGEGKSKQEAEQEAARQSLNANFGKNL